MRNDLGQACQRLREATERLPSPNDLAESGSRPIVAVPDAGSVGAFREWLQEATTTLAACSAHLDLTMGLTLEMEPAEYLHDAVRFIRDTTSGHVFSASGLLARLAPKLQTASRRLMLDFNACYRELMGTLEPYVKLQRIYATRPFGGSTNPIEIEEATFSLHRRTQAIHMTFGAFAENALALLIQIGEELDAAENATGMD
jgi:hypothetical protein